MVDSWWQWEFSHQKLSSFKKTPQNYIHVKINRITFLVDYTCITQWCDSLTSWADWHATMCVDNTSRECHSNIHCTVICDWGQGQSRSIFDFHCWLLPKICLDCWSGSVYFRYIFVRYLLAKLWSLWENRLTVVLCPKSDWPFTLNAVADCSTVAIDVTPPWILGQKFGAYLDYAYQVK